MTCQIKQHRAFFSTNKKLTVKWKETANSNNQGIFFLKKCHKKGQIEIGEIIKTNKSINKLFSREMIQKLYTLFKISKKFTLKRKLSSDSAKNDKQRARVSEGKRRDKFQ